MEDIELIEAYFRNELSTEERASFQVRLQTEKEFASEVANYQLITGEIKQMADEADLKEKMSRWDEEDTSVGNRSFSSFTPWRVAAVLVPLLLISGLIYYYTTITSDQRDLFVAYFSPYEDVITNRSSLAGDFGAAMSAYNTKDYHKAIEFFNRVLREENDSERVVVARFYQAMAYLSIGEMTEAERLLQQVVQADNPLFREVSQWYLLLVFLRTDQTAALEKQLKLIVNDPEHLYFKEASELQAELAR